MNLFQLGDFTLHSGNKSRWKIDCDALSNHDIEALAVMLTERLLPFGDVIGVPRGGFRIAEALRKHIVPGCHTLLIVDDVLTTGASMEQLRRQLTSDGEPSGTIGAVLFARGPCPDWIMPLFRMD